MEENQEHLAQITQIRSMMERSSRFLSLSGLSGVFAGLYALAGAAVAYWYLGDYVSTRAEMGSWNTLFSINSEGVFISDLMMFLIVDAGLVLFMSLITGAFFTWRKANRNGLKIWDGTALRMAINLAIPLGAGGVFGLILLYHNLIGLIAPVCLIFYGLALINASKYTFNDIRFLGIIQIVLGLVAAVYVGYGLIFWALGFGVFHIIYGTYMYFKYERNQ